MNRTKIRELAFKTLFQLDTIKSQNDLTIPEALTFVVEDDKQVHNEFLNELTVGVVEQQQRLDEVIERHLKKWTLSRLSRMDRNILRLATFELMNLSTPYKVIINEAIELSKLYSDKDDSYRFINGVLTGIVSEIKQVS